MNSKYLSNKKGSILTYLIVIISILSIIGFAIINVTYSGYLGKLNQYHEKTAQRLAEAGLNEAYAYLLEEVENAIDYSRNTYIPTMLLNNPDISTMALAPRQARMDTLFQDGYKAYFRVNQVAIEARLEDALSLNAVTGYLVTGESIENIVATVSQEFGTDVDSMIINFTTTVRKTDHQNQARGATRSIRANLVIGIPDYSMPQREATVTIKRNALLDHALVADGNLFVSGGLVTINGNATIRGNDGDFDSRQPEEAGGVIIGGTPTRRASGSNDLIEIPGFPARSGRLTIGNGGNLEDGDLNTGKYVRIAFSRTGTNASSLSVAGDLRCNTLALQRGDDAANPNSAASVTVNRNALILDDLEMDSANSNVEIIGSYFGFSDGSASSDSMHNQSSSIVINNRNFGTDGSELEILGTTNFVLPDQTLIANGTYIAGTNYLDDGARYTLMTEPSHGRVSLQADGSYVYLKSDSGAFREEFTVRRTAGESGGEVQVTDILVGLNVGTNESRVTGSVAENYQTGDSLSIAENYVSYTRILTGADIDPGVDITTAPAEMVGLDEVENFQEIGPHLVVNNLRNSVNEMTPREKSQYSFFSINENRGGINFGGGEIELENVMYSLGTFLGLNGSEEVEEKMGEIPSVLLPLRIVARDYAHKTQALGDPQHPDYTAVDAETSWLSGGIDTWLKGSLNVGGIAQEPDIRVDESSMPDDNTVTRSDGNTVTLSDGSIAPVADVFYLQPASNNRVVVLSGSGASAGDLASIMGVYPNAVVLRANGNTRGVIIANADLFLIGNIDFTGLIAAKGNIYCLGDGTKTISNTNTSTPGNYLTQLVCDGIQLNDRRHIGFWFRQEDAWREQIAVLRGTALSGDEFIGSMPSLRNVITLTDWTVQ